MIDSYKHIGLRRRLVAELENKGITDRNVLEAIETVPRHFFFDKEFRQHAYEDKAFPIADGQTISQPYTVAYQSQMLEIKPGDKVLEIGTGSGYQAAVLVNMGAEVYSVERQKNLFEQTKKLFEELEIPAHLFFSDGTMGLPEFAPFDKIIVTAGGPEVPQALLQQLKVGGILVIPIGDNMIQVMCKFTRTGENKIQKKEYEKFSFVPLIGEQGWKKK